MSKPNTNPDNPVDADGEEQYLRVVPRDTTAPQDCEYALARLVDAMAFAAPGYRHRTENEEVAFRVAIRALAATIDGDVHVSLMGTDVARKVVHRWAQKQRDGEASE